MFPFEFTALEMKNIFYNICKSKRGKYIKKKKKSVLSNILPPGPFPEFGREFK